MPIKSQYYFAIDKTYDKNVLILLIKTKQTFFILSIQTTLRNLIIRKDLLKIV